MRRMNVARPVLPPAHRTRQAAVGIESGLQLLYQRRIDAFGRFEMNHKASMLAGLDPEPGFEIVMFLHLQWDVGMDD